MSLECININISINIRILADYLTKWIKVIYSMICSFLFSPIPLNAGEFVPMKVLNRFHREPTSGIKFYR